MTFSHDIKRYIINKQAGLCGYPKCPESVHSIHHIIANSKTNRKIYGKKLQSAANGIGLCQTHHINTAWLKPVKDKLIKKWKENNSKVR